jgi:hypothetical protein
MLGKSMPSKMRSAAAASRGRSLAGNGARRSRKLVKRHRGVEMDARIALCEAEEFLVLRGPEVGDDDNQARMAGKHRRERHDRRRLACRAGRICRICRIC